MVNVPCVAHSLALCTSQAAESIVDFKENRPIQTDQFYYFCAIPKQAYIIYKYIHIRNIQKLLENPHLQRAAFYSIDIVLPCSSVCAQDK